MRDKKKELELLDAQMIISFVILGAVIVSLIINYNNQLKQKGEKTFLTPEEIKVIAIIIRIVILILILVAIGINLEEIEVLKAKGAPNSDIDAAYLSLWASVIVIIPAIMMLMSSIMANELNDVLIIENPGL